MLSFRNVGVAAVVLVILSGAAAAQSVNERSERDSLLNGTLIGLAAGVGSAAALDAVFCENGFGGCDVPWAAYLMLGGIGAGAGAGIDFLIGRNSGARSATVRVAPIVTRARKGIVASIALPLGRDRGRGLPSTR